MTSVPIEVARRRQTIASRHHDRALGAICVVACPTISGVFFGFVAVVCAYAGGSAHVAAVGLLVAFAAFAANGLAICLTASAVHSHDAHRETERPDGE